MSCALRLTLFMKLMSGVGNEYHLCVSNKEVKRINITKEEYDMHVLIYKLLW